MVKKQLPGNIYRCKGIVYTSEYPQQRAILQVVGRRTDIALDASWGDAKPQTQIVAIAAAGSIDSPALTAQFESCIGEG